MQSIVGQAKLVQILSDFTITSMPATMLLLGAKGSGKSFIIARFARKLGLPLVEVTKDTTAEELVDFQQSPEIKLYHINLVGIEEKQQNKFLKFIEEPSERVRIVLEAESEIGILPTIINRCQKFSTEPYSIEELTSFLWAPKSTDPLLYKFCKTPGQLLNLAETSCFKSLYTLCTKIVETFPRLGDFGYPDAISICTKIVTKQPNVRKYDLDLFLDMLAFVSFEDYKLTGKDFSYKAYVYTIRQKQKILNKSITKEDFIISFLDGLWRVARYDTCRA